MLRRFFSSTPSNIVNSGGPTPEEQVLAMAEDRYWIVLNSHLLRACGRDKELCSRVNAFKHALQTYGPMDNKNLPDFRHNEGLARGFVFHGHVRNKKTTYVLEWTIIPNGEERIIALLGFDTHENYRFRQRPVDELEQERILSTSENLKIMEHAEIKISEAKEKVARSLVL